MRNSYFLAASLLIGAAPAVAQEKTPVDRKSGEVEITFANGSTVRMVIDTPALEVRTPYGTLVVPVKDLKQIDFGIHLSDDVEHQIDDAIHKLNAENVRERETATSALLKLGADAYPAVHQAAQNSTDLETAKRAKALLQIMTQKIPAKDLRAQYNDSIVTRTFTIVGRIVTPTVKAKADYFAAAELQVAQFRSLRSGDVPLKATRMVQKRADEIEIADNLRDAIDKSAQKRQIMEYLNNSAVPREKRIQYLETVRQTMLPNSKPGERK
jgi:hypothetical protein